MKPPILAAVVLCLMPLASPAGEYHVARGAPNASDDNPGTVEKPWRTILKASVTAQAGDRVFIHAGTYPESVTIQNVGTPDKPIVFKAFADDLVVMDGAETIPADKWQAASNSQAIFTTPLDHDPGQVLVDGKQVFVKVDQVTREYPRQYKLGMLTDADTNFYRYDDQSKRVLLNLGGDAPAKHELRLPVRLTAIHLAAHCRVSGITARHYVGTAFYAGGDDAVIEDCMAIDCGGGICIGGWDRRGVVVRRNTVIGMLGSGIFLQDRPTGCRVEDNLAVRCTLNPACEDCWIGSIKMNSAADTVFAHNVVLEAGNPRTDCGHDGWALWGDINIVRVFYVGNSCANNKEAGLYIEYAMGDTRAYFNTSYRNGHGITCRQSQRGVFMRNLVLESRSSGLAVWGGGEPYPTIDHVFAHNLVRDCDPAIWFQIEQPNFADYNTYWPRKDKALAWGQAPPDGKTPQYKDLAEWTKATGHDAHSQVRDAQPGDVGLDTVTFRVAEAKDSQQVLMMVGNNGCEFEDPAGVNMLPYFWRAGTGDGVEHTFLYSAYCGLEGGVDTFAYPGAGGTLALRADTNIVHSGFRCLEINGFETNRLPSHGIGFGSPSLPVRPGDTLRVSWWVRGKDIKPTEGAAAAAFVDFSSATGQQKRRMNLLPAGVPNSGTFGWTRIEATAQVPDTARRAVYFFGLRPATGTLWLDDLSITVR